MPLDPLHEAQFKFTTYLGRFLLHLPPLGYQVSLDEAFRPPALAILYANQGKGIKNSLHCIRLAIDLNLFRGGVLLTQKSDFLPAGTLWTSYDPACRWGGNFHSVDLRHFSLAIDARG